MTEGTRIEDRIWAATITAACLAAGIYHLSANYFGLLQPIFHTSMHVGMMLFIAFLIFADRAPWWFGGRIVNTLFACAAGAACWYTSIFFIDIQERGIFPIWSDKLFALVAIASILEVTRRAYGLPLPVIALVVLVYAVIGGYLPGGWRHSTWDLDFLTYTIFMGSDGIFGVAAKTSAVLIFTFVMLGAFLEKLGATTRIITLATEITKPYAGGSAKVAVIASGLMGTISGSAVANVVATGRFTIPMMIKHGFRPQYAAGVEAVASTGGLIMPPIMGAGAFVMAEILGISYWSIAVAAVVPAILYYIVVFTAVHFEARRLGHVGGSREIALWITLIKGAPFLLPIVVLIGLVSMQVPPVRAALYTMVFVVLLGIIIVRPLSPKLIVSALVDGTREAVPIACACACAGIIIGTLNGTGFAIKFSSLVIEMSGGIPYVVLFLSMLVVIFLGLALPATASYLIGAAVVAAPMVELGYPVLAVHLFIFYFSNLAHITPPVDLATYAAASIARTNPITASFSALRLGLVAFVLPYLFISEPVLLLIDFEVVRFLEVAGTAVIGCTVLSGGLMGWFGTTLNRYTQAFLIVAGFLLLQPNFALSILGGVLALGFIVFVAIERRRERNAPVKGTH